MDIKKYWTYSTELLSIKRVIFNYIYGGTFIVVMISKNTYTIKHFKYVWQEGVNRNINCSNKLRLLLDTDYLFEVLPINLKPMKF